jgi:hypothetical protein
VSRAPVEGTAELIGLRFDHSQKIAGDIFCFFACGLNCGRSAIKDVRNDLRGPGSW